MKLVKKRKPRGFKKDGKRSLDMCPCCISFHCNWLLMSDKFNEKIEKKKSLNLCPSCGSKSCKCKLSLTKYWNP